MAFPRGRGAPVPPLASASEALAQEAWNDGQAANGAQARGCAHSSNSKTFECSVMRRCCSGRSLTPIPAAFAEDGGESSSECAPLWESRMSVQSLAERPSAPPASARRRESGRGAGSALGGPRDCALRARGRRDRPAHVRPRAAVGARATAASSALPSLVVHAPSARATPAASAPALPPLMHAAHAPCCGCSWCCTSPSFSSRRWNA
jgi:hypothetical protein